MARLFISHSSVNNAAAVALTKWLSEQGFDDIYLDIDPDRGLALGGATRPEILAETLPR